MFALASLVGLLVNIALYGLIFVLSLYFQRVNGLTAFQTGLAFVPMMGAVLPVNLIAPRIAGGGSAPPSPLPPVQYCRQQGVSQRWASKPTRAIGPSARS